MKHTLSSFALLVPDYEEAITYYTSVLPFVVLEDTLLSPTKRWVRIGLPGNTVSILLAKAKNEAEIAAIGNQCGGRVFLFLETDDFDRDYQKLQAHNVSFMGPPRTEDYGEVVVFQDIYGHKWDLIQRHVDS